MGNRKRSRVQKNAPKDKLGENEQQNNMHGLHPLLINLIVRQVMTFLDLTDIRKFRGVNRLWNQEAIGLLRELKKPLFYLRLDTFRYFDGNRYLEQHPLGDEKILLDLSKIVGLAGSGSWPPISLHLNSHYQKQSARQSKGLSWIFEHHVSDLVKFIISRGSFAPEIPIPLETTLALKNFKLSYSGYYHETYPDHPTTFLAACTQLQKLDINVEDRDCPDLPLPKSLTTLKLSLQLEYSSEFLVALENKLLPNLTKLSLRIDAVAFVNGTFYKLLDKFRANLKYLRISSRLAYGSFPPETIEEYRFPVMDNLEELKFVGFFQPLEANINNLQLYLPKLKKLSLINIIDSSAEKWLSGHRLETVTSLQIYCVEGREDTWIFRNTDQEMVAKICTTFPNLTSLSLAFTEKDVSGLLTVFEKMQQLEKLTIYYAFVKKIICGLRSMVLKPSAKKKLRSKRNESDLSRMETQNVTYSLLNLTELKQLCIAPLTAYYDQYYYDDDDPIPDALVTQTFLKMGNLRSLCLGPGLTLSKPMERTWMSRGRTLKLERERPMPEMSYL